MTQQQLADALSFLGKTLATRRATWRLEQALKRLEWQAAFDAAHRLSETHTLSVRTLRAELATLRQRSSPRAENHPTFAASERCLN